jgi:hypothetical protein
MSRIECQISPHCGGCKPALLLLATSDDWSKALSADMALSRRGPITSTIAPRLQGRSSSVPQMAANLACLHMPTGTANSQKGRHVDHWHMQFILWKLQTSITFGLRVVMQKGAGGAACFKSWHACLKPNVPGSRLPQVTETLHLILQGGGSWQVKEMVH